MAVVETGFLLFGPPGFSSRYVLLRFFLSYRGAGHHPTKVRQWPS